MKKKRGQNEDEGRTKWRPKERPKKQNHKYDKNKDKTKQNKTKKTDQKRDQEKKNINTTKRTKRTKQNKTKRNKKLKDRRKGVESKMNRKFGRQKEPKRKGSAKKKRKDKTENTERSTKRRQNGAPKGRTKGKTRGRMKGRQEKDEANDEEKDEKRVKRTKQGKEEVKITSSISPSGKSPPVQAVVMRQSSTSFHLATPVPHALAREVFIACTPAESSLYSFVSFETPAVRSRGLYVIVEVRLLLHAHFTVHCEREKTIDSAEKKTIAPLSGWTQRSFSRIPKRRGMSPVLHHGRTGR